MIVAKRLHLKGAVTMIRGVEGSRAAVTDATNAIRFFKLDPVELLTGNRVSS
jgi:hypothetical protein